MIEGQGGGQHGEDRILKLMFRGQDSGVVVDVGAADGWDNSNSFQLLQRPGWSGVLIEPEPTQFEQLRARYQNRLGVRCVNVAIGRTRGFQTLWCGGQVSTFKEGVKRSAEENHGVVYSEAKVLMTPLSRLLTDLKVGPQIDFLSIDVEGMNYEAWQSLDTRIHSPRLVCIEGKGYAMTGYLQLCRVGCNTFYLREDECARL